MDILVSVVVGAVVGSLGLGGAVLIVLVANPEKAQLWSAWIWGLLRRITKSAELSYIATDVAAQVNAHLSRDVLPSIVGLSATRIAIRWDNSGSLVSQESEGTLIVRLRQHEDRLVNVLNAYLAASPRLYAPTIRSQLSTTQSRSIDLQLCRKLAESLSASALTVYRINILDPSLQTDPALAGILEDLKAIDLGGLFVPVLLQELVKLGAAYPADSLPGLDVEVARTIDFLKTVSQREPGEFVELSFIGQFIRINTLLVARGETRDRGVEPFRSRIGIELAKGVDTFYVMATDRNIDFAKEVADALDGDRRLLRRDARTLVLDRAGVRVKGIIIPFERNLGYAVDELLQQGIATGAIAPGTEHTALITDVQASYLGVDVDGMQGIIPVAQVDWLYVRDCRPLFAVGDEVQVKVISAKPEQQELVVSRRLCLPNPVAAAGGDTLRGQRLAFVVTGRMGRELGRRFLVGYLKGHPAVPARLGEGEWEWGSPMQGLQHVTDGQEIAVVVHDVRMADGYVTCSRKRLSADKWADIRVRYPRGMRLQVRVAAPRPEGVWCEIEPGLSGFVPADEFRQAGLEFSDFERNLRHGQELYVHVTRVVAGDRQRVNLGLQRNLRDV